MKRRLLTWHCICDKELLILLVYKRAFKILIQVNLQKGGIVCHMMEQHIGLHFGKCICYKQFSVHCCMLGASKETVAWILHYVTSSLQMWQLQPRAGTNSEYDQANSCWKLIYKTVYYSFHAFMRYKSKIKRFWKKLLNSLSPESHKYYFWSYNFI